MKTGVAFVIGLIFSLRISAQTFTHSAAIPRVQHDGFYKIPVTPEFGSYLFEDFRNFRIVDKNNKEIPYLIDEDVAEYSKLDFHNYAIVEKRQKQGCCTNITLRNDDKAPINNISLIIKNAEVTKDATLYGSDDGRQWYALKQHFPLNYINNTSATSEVKIIDFPLSNYTYYSIVINDSATAPLNIINAGFYDIQTETGKYIEIPDLAYKVTDSVKEKATFILLTFPKVVFVDKIDLKLTGAQFFKRTATLYLPKTISHRKGKRKIQGHFNEYINKMEVSSTHATTFSFSRLKTKQILMVIDNQDNPPLTVESAHAYQLNRIITAWLEKGVDYSVMIGQNLPIPSYDLNYFRDSIPDSVPLLNLRAIHTVPILQVKKESHTFFNNRLLIWVAIIGVILVLGLMSVKMIRETSNDK